MSNLSSPVLHSPSFLERLFYRSVSTPSRLKMNGLRLFMAMVMAGHRFSRNHGFGEAAELAYGTLFALVPVTALGVMVVTRFASSAEAVQRFLLEHLLPSSSLVVSQYLNEFAARVGAIGAISSLFLAVATLSLLHNIETAINDIWEVRTRRSFLVKIAAYWSLLTLGPLLLLGSLYLTTQLRQTPVLSAFLGIGIVRQTVTYVLALVFMWTACFLLYTQLPQTRVRVSAGLVGAIIAGTLWHLAKYGFDEYVSLAVAYHRIYGPLSVVPFFLLWLYLTWVIILWGTELSYVWQNLPFLKGRLSAERLSGWDRVDVAVRILVCSARSFLKGEGKIPAAAISLETQLDLRHVQKVAGVLEQGGMLHCLDESDRWYVLARPPAAIELAEVFSLFDDGSTIADAGDAVDVYMTSLAATVRDATREHLGGMTLQTVLDALEQPRPHGEEIDAVGKR